MLSAIAHTTVASTAARRVEESWNAPAVLALARFAFVRGRAVLCRPGLRTLVLAAVPGRRARAPGRPAEDSSRRPRRPRFGEARPTGLSSVLRGEPREGQLAGVAGGVAERFLDAQQLVVLGDPLAARRGTGLDLAAAGGHRQVGDRGVLGLAGAVAHHALVAAGGGQPDRVQGLREGADLVDLDQQRVGHAAVDAVLQPLRVGDEQVVPDQLHLVTDLGGQLLPAVPVVL